MELHFTGARQAHHTMKMHEVTHVGEARAATEAHEEYPAAWLTREGSSEKALSRWKLKARTEEGKQAGGAQTCSTLETSMDLAGGNRSH